MTDKRAAERRKANQVAPKERRGHKPDRRRCPDCGSSVRTLTEAFPGGTVTKRYCSKCHWKQTSRQMDVERIRSLIGFETEIHGSLKRPILELDPDLLKAAGWNLKDTLELKPLYTPGAGQTLAFVLKKVE
jgi:hypothetical protein